MVDEAMLPLPDASVDDLLCVHCLEVAERAGPLLREMWRVLAPEGRLLIIVPNRRGLWARFDTTPFGHGRPYSRGQLERLLTDALFTPHAVDVRALHAADGPALAAAVGDRVRARRRPAVAGLRRRHHRRGAQGADGRAAQGQAGEGQDGARARAWPAQGRLARSFRRIMVGLVPAIHPSARSVACGEVDSGQARG